MANVYYIPNGTKNLKLLFPALDWDNITEYYTEIKIETEVDNIIATTPINKVTKLCETDVRLHFVNYLGGVDSVIFHKFSVNNDSKSEQIQSTVSKPLDITQHAINRSDIRANDFFRCEEDFEESDLEWLMELFNSPYVWMEWTATQGQTSDSYIPIVILDSKTEKFKRDERYSYTISIEFALSNEKMILRG